MCPRYFLLCSGFLPSFLFPSFPSRTPAPFSHHLLRRHSLIPSTSRTAPLHRNLDLSIRSLIYILILLDSSSTSLFSASSQNLSSFSLQSSVISHHNRHRHRRHCQHRCFAPTLGNINVFQFLHSSLHARGFLFLVPTLNIFLSWLIFPKLSFPWLSFSWPFRPQFIPSVRYKTGSRSSLHLSVSHNELGS